MKTAYLPTLKQLQYLVALADHGHFGRAADAACVSQSTLSAGLRELETLLGVILVERTRRVVRFTPLGLQVAARARKVLRVADELLDTVAAAGKPLAGELRLGIIPTVAPFLLPRLLPALAARFPDLKLKLREEGSALACDALARGQLDCVLLALPYACGEIDWEELGEDRLFVAMPGNQADDPAPTIRADAIDETRLLLLADGHCLKDHALAACNRPELRADATMLGSSLHTLVQMVHGGMGVTLLPEIAITAGILAGTDVVARPLEAERASRRIVLAWRRGSPREAEFRLLAEAARTALRSLRVST